jgi:hypothetical protein
MDGVTILIEGMSMSVEALSVFTHRLTLTACVAGLLAGCGGATTAPAPDPADATSCADLADKYFEITANLIDMVGDRTDSEMESPPAEFQAAGDDWLEVTSQIWPRVAELCDGEEFDQLLCERISEIEPAGEAGERILRDNFPRCEP